MTLPAWAGDAWSSTIAVIVAAHAAVRWNALSRRLGDMGRIPRAVRARVSAMRMPAQASRSGTRGRALTTKRGLRHGRRLHEAPAGHRVGCPLCPNEG